MKSELADFDVFPRILPIGREVQITLRPRYEHARITPEQALLCRVRLYPAGGAAGWTQSVPALEPPLQWADGGLRFDFTFKREQEYVLFVENSSALPRARSFEFRFYALEADLLARRPYKGDLHMHSTRSDGREAPANVAAACRQIGMDFMAVTDHRQYAPSLEAAAAFAGLPLDLRIYPGEEVHPPDNPVHIINFGGSLSVNELFSQHPARYQAEVAALAAGMTGFPAGVDRYTVASSEWCFQQIRAGGGLSIFCHPYWFSNHRYDIPEDLVSLLLERQAWDALEVIGGYHLYELESNHLQVARYHEERARGRRIPLVGVSDAHGCNRADLFGWYYSIVFAPVLDLPQLVASVKDLYSVAVEALPGADARAHGPFRLVRYAQFLLREIFPLHDALCAEEGDQMLAHLAGDPQAAARLAQLQGRAAAFYAHCGF